ncbi:MAG: hypothetical protein FWG83_02950 [Oscillospiraceae bacterium]|nr:hypothetical protein [Oscillospiraceae bacterium]
MITIKHHDSGDGQIKFVASGNVNESSLTMKIDGSKASIVEIKSDDNDIRDGLLKSAFAFTSRRGVEFDAPLNLKPSQCQSN